jgi:hypothetical protein
LAKGLQRYQNNDLRKLVKQNSCDPFGIEGVLLGTCGGVAVAGAIDSKARGDLYERYMCHRVRMIKWDWAKLLRFDSPA